MLSSSLGTKWWGKKNRTPWQLLCYETSWRILERDIKHFYTKLRVDERNHIFMSSFPDINMWDIHPVQANDMLQIRWRFCIVRDDTIFLLLFNTKLSSFIGSLFDYSYTIYLRSIHSLTNFIKLYIYLLLHSFILSFFQLHLYADMSLFWYIIYSRSQNFRMPIKIAPSVRLSVYYHSRTAKQAFIKSMESHDKMQNCSNFAQNTTNIRYALYKNLQSFLRASTAYTGQTVTCAKNKRQPYMHVITLYFSLATFNIILRHLSHILSLPVKREGTQ